MEPTARLFLCALCYEQAIERNRYAVIFSALDPIS